MMSRLDTAGNVVSSSVSITPGTDPVGVVIWWPGSVLPPGYLPCDGTTFDRTIYPDLYAYLGSDRTPDLRDQYVRGAGNVAALTSRPQSTGYPRTPLALGASPTHNHSTRDAGEHDHYGNYGSKANGTNESMVLRHADGSWWANSGFGYRSFAPDGGHNHSVTSSGSHTHTLEGWDAETRPETVVMALIMRALP